MIGEDYAQGERAGDEAKGLPYGGLGAVLAVAPVKVLHKVCGYLRISLGHEGIALLGKKITELDVVFHYAVVNQSHIAVLAEMWVGVYVVGLPVGCPAGMAYAEAAGQGSAAVRHFLQHAQPALGLHDAKLIAVCNGYS